MNVRSPQFKAPSCSGPPSTLGWSRRRWLQSVGGGLGGVALAHLLAQEGWGRPSQTLPGALVGPHHAPRAKRIIYLFQSGGPSQLETFDYKPLLNEQNGKALPDSVRQGQRLTGMSAHQAILPMAGSIFPFAQHGPSGAWISSLLPHTASIADDLCVLRAMHTEAINHDPAITFLQTGSQIAGRPSIGAWLGYGLGSDNANLPAFVVLVTKGQGGQPLYSRLWGSAFLPSQHQGVQFRAGREPVLFLNRPAGVDGDSRRELLDGLGELHELQRGRTAPDSDIDGRIAQYEMAFRMQTSVPEATDVADEPERTFEAYGPDSRTPGTYAANCLLARRLAERGVKFVQLYHQDWDHHGGLPGGIKRKCLETDQASAALVSDLKQRGMLDETLVIWGGEFGRTNYSQGKLTATDYGRDHHPRCFSIWMAGGGVKPGFVFGETCPFGYNVQSDGVHVRDFHATLLHLLGIDHQRLTYRFQGLDAKLTGVEASRVVREILS